MPKGVCTHRLLRYSSIVDHSQPLRKDGELANFVKIGVKITHSTASQSEGDTLSHT